MKFDAVTGGMTWNYQIGSKLSNSGGATTYGVAVAGSNVYVTGNFIGTGSGSVNFNPAGNHKLSSRYYSGYDLKLTTSGAFVWVTPFTAVSGGVVQSYSIAVDGPDSAGKGNVYTYGAFQGSVAFDAKHTLNAGTGAAFITKLDKNGKLAWVDQLGGGDNAYPSHVSGGLTVVATGGSYDGVYVTGQFDNTPSGFLGLTSQGGRDIFVARFDSTNGSNGVGRRCRRHPERPWQCGRRR